jgi:hypothetical protein
MPVDGGDRPFRLLAGFLHSTKREMVGGDGGNINTMKGHYAFFLHFCFSVSSGWFFVSVIVAVIRFATLAAFFDAFLNLSRVACVSNGSYVIRIDTTVGKHVVQVPVHDWRTYELSVDRNSVAKIVQVCQLGSRCMLDKFVGQRKVIGCIHGPSVQRGAADCGVQSVHVRIRVRVDEANVVVAVIIDRIVEVLLRRHRFLWLVCDGRLLVACSCRCVCFCVVDCCGALVVGAFSARRTKPRPHLLSIRLFW